MVILINGYVGPRQTGIGNVLLNTVNSLVDKDPSLQLIFVTNYDNNDLLEDLDSRVIIRRIPISKKSTLLNLLYNIFYFPLISLSSKIDLVYISNFIMILFAFKPTITVIHDLIEFKVEKKFSWLRMLYRKMAVPSMARNSAHIITVSENSKNDIISILGVDASKISVVYNGIPNVESHLVDSIRNNIKNACLEPYVLFIGTVDHPGKNLHSAILAFEIYKERTGSKINFLIAGGPGHEFDVVIGMIKKSKFNRSITYLGYVSNHERNYLYKRARIFIYLSFYEGFGLPLLEAMSHGIPVLTSDRSCLPEIASDAAVIVDPDDLLTISMEIQNLSENKELRRLCISNGMIRIKDFKWENTALETLEILENIYFQRNIR
jgi:glycosyltransferase involved in cell wall biosynthesis